MAAILVIDEYAPFRETMEYCLPKFGHTVWAAPRVEEGMAHARTHGVDIVLLDIGLPGLAGLGDCAVLKRDPVLGRVPVVILASQLTAEIVTRARAAGAEEVLGKTFQWPHLLEAIARLVPGDQP